MVFGHTADPRKPWRSVTAVTRRHTGNRPVSVHRSRRCRVRELPDCTDDPAPDRHAGGINNRPELGGPADAFHLGRVSVALEHQAGNAPNIDFGYHAAETARSRSINA